MSRRIPRSYYSGHPLDVPAVIAALEACIADTSGDPMPASDEPDEPVVSDEDTYRRRQDEYERGLDYDRRRAS